MNKIKEKDNKNSEDFQKLPVRKFFKNLKFILFFIIIITLFLAIKTGIEISKWQNLAQDMISNTPSIVYDTNGDIIANLGSSKNISNISLSSIPDNLKNAYISIEDQRFYKHSGVDLPRTTAAILSYIRNLGSSSFGGSSITQQLVKNLTGDNSSKISRKLNEWIKAFALENVLTKDQILEGYLNIIYVGPNIYGVDLASKYYFDKNISELSLEECAFIAGINNSPNSYNPFGDTDNTSKINNRTKTVLKKMNELGYITDEEFQISTQKVENGLKFKNGKIEKDSSSNIYSYHTDALLTQIINDISKRKNISKEFAENYINMAGLKIYSTQNSKIQNMIESEFKKEKYILKSKTDPSKTSQAAMVIIDHSTGNVVGCVGGIGEKSTSRGFNRATQALRQTGSAGKPISVLVPALSENLITPASIYSDEETTFDDGTENGYSPTDYNSYRGKITVRQAVESSQNIPFVKIMEEVTPKLSIKYMKKLGISTLTKTDNNLNLALGGLDKGISPLELATAYATIANDGIYIEPTFYSRIENSSGKTILKPKQIKKKVLKKEVCFIIKSLLKEPVEGVNGTAQYCKISGIDTAAKTGTTNDEFDRWLCGFTPYYTAVTWFGFDLNETIYFNHKNPSGQIWASVMKNIHQNLKNATFEIPATGVESVIICRETGLLASSTCKNSYTEFFIKGTQPTSYCLEESKSTLTEDKKQNDNNKESEKEQNNNKQSNDNSVSSNNNQAGTESQNENISDLPIKDQNTDENSNSNINSESNVENNSPTSDSGFSDSEENISNNLENSTTDLENQDESDSIFEQ